MQEPADGDIIFSSPRIEFLRFRGSDGAVLVKGKVVSTDQDVFKAFKEWLSAATSSAGPISRPAGNGSLMIQSGAAGLEQGGKDVIVENSKGEPKS